MSLVSLTLPSDGETIDAADVNVPFNALANVLNGNIDSTNVSSLNGTKINAGTIPGTAIDSTLAGGWLAAGETWTYGANNGQKEHTVTISGDKTAKYSPGMRIKLDRGTTPPTQCTDLEADTSQYWSKTSPSGITFTDDFTCEAWIKLESYGTIRGIMNRRNVDTEGWCFRIDANGTVSLIGLRIAGNNQTIQSFQSVPLGRWVHVAAALDMSGGTGAIYIDGVAVPTTNTTNGTATALVQGTSALVVGAEKSAGTNPFDGELADVRLWSVIRTASQIRENMNQLQTGSESNLVAYFKFNGDANDSTSNANNLSAVNSATATTSDNPMKSTEYGIITKVSYSVPNTTLTIFTGTDYNIPNMTLSNPYYSTQKTPVGFNSGRSLWRVTSILRSALSVTSNSNYGSFQSGKWSLSVPTGEWDVGYQAGAYSSTTTEVRWNISPTALTGIAGTTATEFSSSVLSPTGTSVTFIGKRRPVSVSSAQSWVMYTQGATTSAGTTADGTSSEIFAECTYL